MKATVPQKTATQAELHTNTGAPPAPRGFAQVPIDTDLTNPRRIETAAIMVICALQGPNWRAPIETTVAALARRVGCSQDALATIVRSWQAAPSAPVIVERVMADGRTCMRRSFRPRHRRASQGNGVVFAKVPRWAVLSARLAPGDLTVLCLIAKHRDHANKDAPVAMAYSFIAKGCAMSERTVIAALRRLECERAITRTRRSSNGRKLMNLYRIHSEPRLQETTGLEQDLFAGSQQHQFTALGQGKSACQSSHSEFCDTSTETPHARLQPGVGNARERTNALEATPRTLALLNCLIETSAHWSDLVGAELATPPGNFVHHLRRLDEVLIEAERGGLSLDELVRLADISASGSPVDSAKTPVALLAYRLAGRAEHLADLAAHGGTADYEPERYATLPADTPGCPERDPRVIAHRNAGEHAEADRIVEAIQ